MLRSIQQRRIVRVVEAHRAKLRDARESRSAAIEQFAGSHYAGRDEMDREPLAMVELAVVVFTHLLSSNCPTYSQNTKDAALLAAAINAELSLNKTMARIRAERAFHQLTQSGMFGLGVIWTGLTDSQSPFFKMVGKVACENVDFDDVVYDTSARAWDECDFHGHRYQVPYEEVMESDLFDPSARDRLKPMDEDNRFDSYGEERIQSLGTGTNRQSDELYDKVELWDIWDRRSNTLITIPADGQDIILRQHDWMGPLTGPYTRLSFNDVPNNILPAAPINVILDLHELVNMLFVHAARQSLRQKNVMTFSHGSEDDATNWGKAKDGEAIATKGSGQMVSTGGADAKTVGMIADALNKYRYFLGNLDSIAGLAPVADTATAEGQILQQANSRLNYMRMRVNDVAQAVGEQVLHYLKADPFMQQRLSRPIPGMNNMYATYDFRGTDIPDDIAELDIRVNQYSMQPKNPQAKLSAMMNIINQIAIPFGVAPADPAYLIRRAAQLADVEAEIENVFMPGQPPMPPQAQQGGGNPNKPNGQYQMNHRSTSTGRGKDAAMAQMMMGGANGQGMQPAEMAQAMGA